MFIIYLQKEIKINMIKYLTKVIKSQIPLQQKSNKIVNFDVNLALIGIHNFGTVKEI